MNDSNDSRMVRLPVHEMRDEPAPQRAAQEGDLPPLPEPQTLITQSDVGYRAYTDYQMREYARLALAAAGGGVPKGDEYVGGLKYRGNSVAYIYQKLTAYRYATDEAWQAMRDAGRGPDGKTKLADAIRNALASSPQPEAVMTQQERDILQGMREIKEGKGSEAAPAVAQVPLCEVCYRENGVVDACRCRPTHHRQDAAPEAPAQAAPSAGEVERGDVVAFEFYNRETGHAIVDYSVNTHVGNLSAAKGYEARPLVYAAPRQNVLDGSKPIPAWQAREALDELEAAARGDAPFNHQAAAVVRAALSHKEQP